MNGLKEGFEDVFVVADLRLHAIGAGRWVMKQRTARKEPDQEITTEINVVWFETTPYP